MHHEPARQQVERFVRRFEPSYRRLAYYSALPLVLTPELVHYLRNQFLLKDAVSRDGVLEKGVPWVAEADLLLSDLCSPVGYEQYAIDPAVRAYLLSEMETVIGRDQMQAVARLLLSYVQQLAQANPEIWQQELKNQQWAAMVYLDDHRESVVGQLAAEYKKWAVAGKITAMGAQAIQAQLDQLVRMTQEMAPQLRDYPELMRYADLLKRLLYEPGTVNPAELAQQFALAPGIEVAVPSVLVGGPAIAAGDTTEDVLWQTFDYEVMTVFFDEDGAGGEDSEAEELEIEDLEIEFFEFDRATVVVSEKGRGRKKVPELEIARQRGQAWQFIERLPESVALEMVAIPAGEFLMGSPPDELERMDREGPQHRVTVPEFYLGKYPVTQAQWRAVAGLPEIERELNPDLANFKGDELPVEQVSWEEAVEFCVRLSEFTRREYRLPSEAEWEYACRAGTTTPFHYGETIITDLANYRGTDWQYEGKTYPGFYGAGPRGEYREQTTEVGSFPANAFGLYDMHGNVWEWCLDHWHGNYEGAPVDGSAWLSDEKDSKRLLRGGSWDISPRICRSAVRDSIAPDNRFNDFGFRVVCVAARTM